MKPNTLEPPEIILTSEDDEQDPRHCYDCGALMPKRLIWYERPAWQLVKRRVSSPPYRRCAECSARVWAEILAGRRAA